MPRSKKRPKAEKPKEESKLEENGSPEPKVEKEEEEENGPNDHGDHDEGFASESSSSSDENNSLALDGLVEKERDLDEYESSSDEEEKKETKKKRRRKGSESSSDSDEDLQVEFCFCDMDLDKYFHGVKTLLGFEPLHVPHSSQLADIILDNVEVGTLVTTQDDPDHNVFAFASALNVSNADGCYGSKPCIIKLQKMILDKCPAAFQKRLNSVFADQGNKSTVGLVTHARMINVPLKIVQVMHEQLIKDMDWAAAGGESKSPQPQFDFKTLLFLAPCSRDGNALYYKYVEDEIFASRSELQFEFDVPMKVSAFAQQETTYTVCSLIVLTRQAYEDGIVEFSKLVPK